MEPELVVEVCVRFLCPTVGGTENKNKGIEVIVNLVSFILVRRADVH
jgi:hypothetical protein